MKKRLIAPLAAMIVTCAAFFASCAWLFEEDWLTKKAEEMTDAAMQRLCTAVANRDAAAVKAEFRYVDVCDLDGFDESVQKLLEYVTGDNVRFKRISVHGEDTAMGSQQPNWRYFPSCRYNILTATDEYKVIFGFYSYYSDVRDTPDPQKAGITYFDIIDKKNDRPDLDEQDLYTGCPFAGSGIHFDYVTAYFDLPYKKAFCDDTENFGPVIWNEVSDIRAFVERYGGEYSLGSRADGNGFADIAAAYDDEFFRTHSLFAAGASFGAAGYTYTPQPRFYIGDFVRTEIFISEYDGHYDDGGERLAEGVIVVWELPQKVPTDIQTYLVRSVSPLIQTT